MANAQFYPDSLALTINTVPVTNVQFSDLNVNNFVWVQSTTAYINGTNTNVFELYYQETNAYELSVYQFPRGANENLDNFKAVLNTWCPVNNVTKYTQWVQLNDSLEFIQRDVLINDDLVTRRAYNSHTNYTTIYVGYRQELIDARFKVVGDQERGYIFYGYYGY